MRLQRHRKLEETWEILFSPMGKLSLDNVAEAAGALPGPSATTAIVTPT